MPPALLTSEESRDWNEKKMSAATLNGFEEWSRDFPILHVVELPHVSDDPLTWLSRVGELPKKSAVSEDHLHSRCHRKDDHKMDSLHRLSCSHRRRRTTFLFTFIGSFGITIALVDIGIGVPGYPSIVSLA